MTQSILRLTILFLVLPFTGLTSSAQDDSDTENERSVAQLVRQLRELTVIRLDMTSEGIVERQRKKIELANQILDHQDASDADFNLATVARLQALGVQFALKSKDKDLDSQLNEEYSDAIEEALDSDEQSIVFEATTASAGFRSGLYTMEPNEENAKYAAEAINNLNEIAPKDPLIQTTRRILLEQMRNSENPKLVFEKLKDSDEKLARIVLEQLEGTTEKPVADFLWAKHFAKFGDFIAQRRLAVMYEMGNGTRVNYSQAARWYGKLARVNDIRALVKLGDFYREGKGYFKNPEAAVKNYQTAAKAQSRVAQFKLAECFRLGEGVTQSDDNWRRWIKTAASNASANDVGLIYEEIPFEGAPDSYRIFYESMVDQNPDDVYYMNNLSYSLLIGSEKDPERSLELIEKAISEAPDDFRSLNSFLDTKATALMQLSKWKEAAEIFETILPDIEDKKPVLESLVKCFQEIDLNKADEYQKQLEQLDDKSDDDKSQID